MAFNRTDESVHTHAYEPIDSDIVRSDVGSTFTKAQVPSTETATIVTSKILDFATYQNFILTLDEGVNTLTNPTTEDGNQAQTGVLILIQPTGTAGTITLGDNYKTAGGAGLTLSSVDGQYDIVPYIIKGTDEVLLGTPQLNFS